MGTKSVLILFFIAIPFVAAHPRDKGIQAITDAFFSAIPKNEVVKKRATTKIGYCPVDTTVSTISSSEYKTIDCLYGQADSR